LLFVIILFFCFPAKAENRVYERVYVHTDKDCYIAGEDIRLKIYVIDSHFQPSDLSKVGYVEICNTEKPLLQIKVALENGGGAGKIEIPTDIPSGIYQLSGYTRYMRNEGEKVFFQKQIAIVNAEQQTLELQRFELIEKPEPAYSTKPEAANVLIKTSQSEYGNREKVVLSIDHIPANTADLVISVSRNDTIAETPEINNQEWLKQVNATLPFSQQWTPEYEGHIITGRLAPEPQEKLSASVAFAGNDVRYFGGQINTQTNTVNFYTADLFGPQQIVTSAISPGYYDKVPYRIDLLSPFSESLPASLPVLPIYRNEGQLMERYLGVQMQKKIDSKTIDNFTQTPNDRTFQPVLSYDLDEYTRFNTISETILEFINKVSVIRMQDKRKISVYIDEEQRSSQRTLVLLDGIPVYDHQDILNYNPMYIKRINIYNECFTFGGNDFDGIVSFLTREGNLPFFQLSNESQLFNYDCPQLPSLFDAPDYSTQPAKNSRKPDFRHTLYWNPFVQFTTGQPVHLSFYTSDLCGLFKVAVEGITTDGEMVQGSINFQVATLSK
jgi:hypothetical protein